MSGDLAVKSLDPSHNGCGFVGVFQHAKALHFTCCAIHAVTFEVSIVLTRTIKAIKAQKTEVEQEQRRLCFSAHKLLVTTPCKARSIKALEFHGEPSKHSGGS